MRLKSFGTLVGVICPITFSLIAFENKPVFCKRKNNNDPVIIVGGGIYGKSIAYTLLSRREQVILFDACHTIRGSWGEQRLIQYLYDDPLYLKLAKRSFKLFNEFEKERNLPKESLIQSSPLIHIVSKLAIHHIEKLARLLEEQGLSYEIIKTGEKLKAIYPMINMKDDEVCFKINKCGIINADTTLEKLEDRILEFGKTCIVEKPVIDINRSVKEIKTADGINIKYSKLILCSGSWTNQLLSKAKLALLPIVVSNEQKIYYSIKEGFNGQYNYPKMPLLAKTFYHKGQNIFVYMMPHHIGRVENSCPVAAHQQGPFLQNSEFIVPDNLDKEFILHTSRLGDDNKKFTAYQEDYRIDRRQEKMTDEFVEDVVPGLDTSAKNYVVRCLYQNNVIDGDFCFGYHPDDADILVATGFGGEGFKFSFALAEVMADLIQGKGVKHIDVLERFKLSRFFN